MLDVMIGGGVAGGNGGFCAGRLLHPWVKENAIISNAVENVRTVFFIYKGFFKFGSFDSIIQPAHFAGYYSAYKALTCK